jgi:SPP1 family predicted phage head-tail adaptor
MTLGARGFADAGQLDHPITWLAFTETTNDYGEVTRTWTPFAEDWAELEPLRPSERMAAAQLQAVVDYTMRVRWRADVDDTNRVEIDGADYDLVGPPMERGRHQYLDFLIRRRDPAAPDMAPMAAT